MLLMPKASGLKGYIQCGCGLFYSFEQKNTGGL